MAKDGTREQIPKMYRGVYDKAMEGKSPKAAISIFCLLCMGCKRKAIRDCADDGCPLFPYRPYQKTPYKFHNPTNPSFIGHCTTGKRVAGAMIGRLGVSKGHKFGKHALKANEGEIDY